MALSTTEAKYITKIEVFKEMLWTKGFVKELGFKQERHIVYEDHQSVIKSYKNPTYHFKMKHIKKCFHYIRSAFEGEELQLSKVHTNNNCAEVMTKNLPYAK